jgi:hypothetical protein
MMNKQVLIFLFLSIFFNNVYGKEVRYLMRSPRSLFMGDAFTALASDEYAAFYNPAAFTNHADLNLALANPTIGVTDALDELDRFENFPSSDAAAIADRILGLPVYIHLGVAPLIKMGPFAMTFLTSSTTSLILRNATHPVLDIDYRLDRGLLFSFAYAYPGKKTPVGVINPGLKTSFGATVKSINRQGISEQFDLFGTTLLQKIQEGSSSVGELREALGFSKGKAWGFDAGIQFDWGVNKYSQLSLGFSLLDGLDTRFREVEGSRELPNQEMYINGGMAWTQKFYFLEYSLSADFHPINTHLDYRRKLHFGASLGIPFIKFFGGWNGGYPSYGVEFKLFIFRVVAGFYAVETGSNYKDEKGSRALLYLNLFNFSFDL